MPEFFADALAGIDDCIDECLIGPENCSVHVAQGNRDGARQGGHVNDSSGAELFRVRDRIGEYQATFSVGVDDFDCFSRHRSEHVAGLGRFS